MRLNVFLEPNPARKRELHEQLTALLPDRFGQPKANAKYATQAEILDGYIAESAGVRRGPLWLKWIGPVSAEVFLDGCRPDMPSFGRRPGTHGSGN
jgi:hypothetical protein